MDPLRALRQIAFLLERSGAPTYRVRAFRRAAAVVEALPADEFTRRVGDGTLAKLAGIGPVTTARAAELGISPDRVINTRPAAKMRR